MELELSRYIKKNNQISDVIKIRPVGAGIFYADGRTDRYAWLS
jgi:hypothetical protein